MKYWGISTIACLLLALGCRTTQPTATAGSIVITDDSATNMFKDLLSVIQGIQTVNDNYSSPVATTIIPQLGVG